jgi:arylsulfatase
VKNGYAADGRTFKVHLDGHNLLPFLKGDAPESPRKAFLYWSDDGDLLGMRVGDWKIVFLENNNTGLEIFEAPPLVARRAPKFFNLPADPFERADSSINYGDWKAHRIFIMVPAQAIVAKWLESFKEFPIRQKPASFSLERVMEKLMPKQG